MGCDIHMAVEKFSDREQRWELVGEPVDEGGGYVTMPAPESGDQRNYYVFAVLADVRNGHLGDKIRPISSPRGCPRDASPEVKRWMADGDYSHSWVTVRELLDYDWQQTRQCVGIVDLVNYGPWKDAGPKTSPAEYCGGAFGPKYKHVSNEEMDRLLERRPPDPENYWTKATWTQPLTELCDSFCSVTIPKLREIGDPDKVRLVFWFDS